MNKKILITALCALAPAAVFSAASNPASKAYVQQVVAESDATLRTNITESIAAQTYKIGQVALGGVVFFVEQDGRHGLVVSLDTFQAPQWSGGPTHVTAATAEGIGAGRINTFLATASQAQNTSTAGGAPYSTGIYSANYNTGLPCDSSSPSTDPSCVTDWYLPSQYEFSILAANLCGLSIPGFTPLNPNAANGYWTSVEASEDNAYFATVSADGCTPTFTSVAKVGTGRLARPIRLF